MKAPKLDRTQQHEINSHPSDQIYFWDSPFDVDRQNMTWKDSSGNDALTIYGVTKVQLEIIYRDIQVVLGLPPEPVTHQLVSIHKALGKLIPQDIDNDIPPDF